MQGVSYESSLRCVNQETWRPISEAGRTRRHRLFSIDIKIPINGTYIFGRPNRKITRKDGLLQNVVLFNRLRWDVPTGLIRSIHIFLSFLSSSRLFTIYFRSFPILREMQSACSERDFLIEIFAFCTV